MKKATKIHLINILFAVLAFTSNALCQSESKRSDVFLSFGQSEITGSNKAVSRKEALKECLTDALRQFVALNTTKRIFELNYGVLKSKIYDSYNTYIKNYRIKGEEAKEGFYKITAEVKLKPELIVQKLKNLGLTTVPGKKPKLLFLISDSITTPEEVKFHSWWFQENLKPSSKYQPLSLKLENQIKNMGFDIVKRDTFISKMESYQITLKKNILKGDIEAIKSMHLGDVLMIGISQIDEQTKKKKRIATAHLSVKTVNLADNASLSNVKRSLNVAYAVKKAKIKGENITEAEALRSFVEEFAGDLVESFLSKWQLSQADMRTVDIDLQDVYSYKNYLVVKKAIKKLKAIIPSVREYTMSKGVFRWTVEFNGNIDQLLSALNRVTVEGNTLNAKSDSPNHIVLRIK